MSNKRIKFKEGETFNNLLICSDEFLYKERWYSIVLCFCGKTFKVRVDCLLSGNTKSCGCFLKETASKLHMTHGMSKEPIYKNYHSMIARCYEVNDQRYPDYGGRGIKVCDRWLEPDGKGFLNFLEDMGETNEGTSLDRINNDGNYEPSNCRRTTQSFQSFNRRKGLTNTSGRQGVYWRKNTNKYYAQITKDGKFYYGGSSSKFEDVVEMVKTLEKSLYGQVRNE